MIISHKYKYIFIKGFKVAGTSVELYLEKFAGEKDIIGVRGDSNYILENQPKWYNHMPAHLIKSNLRQKIWEDYFKFCICRNPWDTAVSLYCFDSKRSPNEYKSFEDFMDKRQGSMINFSSFYSPIQDIDFFIKFENLYEDLSKVCEKLGIPYEENSIPRKKAEFRDRSIHYSAYYNDRTIKMIEKECKDDIEYFGYKFEKGENS